MKSRHSLFIFKSPKIFLLHVILILKNNGRKYRMRRARRLRKIQKAQQQNCQPSRVWDDISEGSEQDSKTRQTY